MLKIEYELFKEDYLEYHLYSSSKSQLHRKRLNRSRIIYPVIFMVFGAYLSIMDQNSIGIATFGGLAVLWYVFFPKYAQWHYVRYLRKYIEENYSNRINVPVQMVLQEQSIYIKDTVSESTVNGSELKQLIETKDCFIIKLSTAVVLLVPKRAVLDSAAFIHHVTRWGAEYVNELKGKEH